MIIIIIIFAKGINHSHVRVRTGQGAGGEWVGRASLIANMRFLARKTHPYPNASRMCQYSTSICPLSAHHLSGIVNPAGSRCLKTNGLNPRWSMMALYLNYMPIEPAKYELTAANLTGNRLSRRKHCLSGHPSLNCNESLWQVVLVSAHWDSQ